MPPPPPHPDDNFNCKLMDSFAIFIQSLLGIVAISTLFLKRQHEVPQRPFLIWFFDVSKQASGSAMVHGLNLFAAYFSGKSSHEDSNPCIWYFMNLVLDTTFGVYILYLYLKLINVIVQRLGIENMDSGDYGSPPRPINWVKQSIAFFMALLSMKVTVMIALALFPFLAIVGRMFLAPFQHLGDPRIQIVMVMLVVPLVMNIIQFWLIDHVIKQKQPSKIYIPDHESPSDESETFLTVVSDHDCDDDRDSLPYPSGSSHASDDYQGGDGRLGARPGSSKFAQRPRPWSHTHFDVNHVHASRSLSRSGSTDDFSVTAYSRFEMNKSP